ncbi:hypothetical protein B0H14DRAFT_2563342 [Mycena olivaceomarginata]|nr:hypothetical protein B0H14DRAFT_2563342 [Mycena olivaceomarginata]
MGTRKSARNISSTISTVTSEDLIDSDAETDMDPERTLIGDEQDIQPLDIQTPRARGLRPHDSVVWAIWTTGASRDSMRVPTKIGLFGFIGRLLRPGLTDDEDWRYYYVNVFVDHDMYMRYRGRGVGHYQVPIPPEDEDRVRDDHREDDQDQEIRVPEAPPAPLVTPPPTPGPEEQGFPDARPGSSLSQNSELREVFGVEQIRVNVGRPQ